MNLQEELKEEYKRKDATVREEAKEELAKFLGVNLEEVKVSSSAPMENGIKVYLEADGLSFHYIYPGGAIEFCLENGESRIVNDRAEVGRLLVLKENKNKYK